MRRKSRWRWLEVSRAQYGWYATVSGTIETHRQFTDQVVECKGDSKYLLIAVCRGFREWRRVVKRLRAEVGPFNNPEAAQEAPEENEDGT